MAFFYYIILIIILIQSLSIIHVYRNYRFALSKYKRQKWLYKPRAILIVPCRGLDTNFEKNITSFFLQDYENYSLWFVVAEKSDPAYPVLLQLKDRLSIKSKANQVKIFTAGQARSSSQKVHNLLYCCRRIEEDIEIAAFADSDICVRNDWLLQLMWPLRLPKNGSTTGYRWYVPEKDNFPTLALSALNAKIAQLLGNTPFNQAWGGSMAIRMDTFKKAAVEEIWQNAITDDLTLSRAVKRAGLKVAFVPACLVASNESTNWTQLLEFGRRQFLITRIIAPGTWLFGLISSLFTVVGIWSSIAFTVYAASVQASKLPLFTLLTIVFLLPQFIHAVLRQKMAFKLLYEYKVRMKAARVVDILGFWLWSILMLVIIISSAFGRTIKWRGIRYKLIGPNKTTILESHIN